MTNGDKIRSMSDEELAELLDKALNQERDDWSSIGCYNCINYNTHHYNERECGNCEWFGGIEKWLKSEVEEECEK